MSNATDQTTAYLALKTFALLTVREANRAMLHSANVLEIMVNHINSNHKESSEMALKG